MTIRRGEDWGVPGELAADALVASSDVELARLLLAGGVLSGGHPEAGLIDGDLARTVGADGRSLDIRAPNRTRLPIDVGVVSSGDDVMIFVAHVVLRNFVWAGRTTAIMNAAFRGSWNVSPRSHPNDGKLDVLVAELSLADRLKARTRLPGGTHVPHPGISVRRATDGMATIGRREIVLVDGVRWEVAGEIVYRVVPDAATIVI